MTENTQEETLTVEDILSEAAEAEYHTVLELWREVLSPAAQQANTIITPQWANRITSAYREINFRDMLSYRDTYFGYINQLLDVLNVEIASDDECLNMNGPEEDVEHNSHHYLNLLIEWQKLFLSWELDWRCDTPEAAVQLAAISEAHRMFFDQTGLTALLESIQFQVTEEDTALMAAALEELREPKEG